MADIRVQALQAAAEGKISEAIALLQPAEKDWEAWHDLGAYCLSQGQIADSVDAFDQAARSGSPVAATSQAVLLLVAGKLSEAVSALQRITAESPECSYAWLNYASLLWAAGRQIETAKAVAKLKELTPEPAQYQQAVIRTTHSRPFEVRIMQDGQVVLQKKSAEGGSIRESVRRAGIPPDLAPTAEYLAERLDTAKEITIGDIRVRDKSGQWVLERYTPRGVEESLPLSGVTHIDYRSGAMSAGRRFMAAISALLLIAAVPARIHSWTLMGAFLGGFLLTLPFVAFNRPKRGFTLRYSLGRDEFVQSTYVFESREQARRIELECIALTLLVQVLEKK